MKHAIMTLALTALISGPLMAQEEVDPDIAVPPAKVRGVVLMQDGETPVDGLRVRVWNGKTEQIVYRSETDQNGVFEVPKYEPNEASGDYYYVTVGPIKVDMRVLTARAGTVPQNHGFVMLMPKRMPLVQTLTPSTLTAAAPALANRQPTSPPEIVSP